MSSLQSISAQIQSIDAIKSDLRIAFEELQSHSSAISISLQWKTIEDYFDLIQRSIDESFQDLQSKLLSKPKASDQPVDQTPPSKKRKHPSAGSLRALLRKNLQDLAKIERRLVSSLQASSKPAKLALDVIDGLADWQGRLFLLEKLAELSPEIGAPEGERALKLALEWKEGSESKVETEALVQLVAAFSLGPNFGVDELFKWISRLAYKVMAVNCCRKLGLADKIPVFVQKLVSKGMHIPAVKFVCAFELTDKFPPVALLEAYLEETKKNVEEICRSGKDSIKSQTMATSKELTALKAVIKSIDIHKLGAGSLREGVEERIVELEKHQADRKRTATVAGLETVQESTNKQPQPAAKDADGLKKAKGGKPRPDLSVSASSLQVTDARPEPQEADGKAPSHSSASS